MVKKLYRNKQEYKIAGICSGIADYFLIDPVIIRLLFNPIFSQSIQYIFGAR